MFLLVRLLNVKLIGTCLVKLPFIVLMRLLQVQTNSTAALICNRGQDWSRETAGPKPSVVAVDGNRWLKARTGAMETLVSVLAAKGDGNKCLQGLTPAPFCRCPTLGSTSVKGSTSKSSSSSPNML